MVHDINQILKLSQFCFWQGIGNGIPLGAVVTTPEIAQALTRRSYFNTFGGNPVCTAAGLAVLKVIEKEKLQENALVVGSHLKDRLNALKDKYECNIFVLYTLPILYYCPSCLEFIHSTELHD